MNSPHQILGKAKKYLVALRNSVELENLIGKQANQNCNYVIYKERIIYSNICMSKAIKTKI